MKFRVVDLSLTEDEKQKMKDLFAVLDTDEDLVRAAAGPNIGAYRVAADMLKEGHREAIQIAVAYGVTGTKLWILFKEAEQSYTKLAVLLLGSDLRNVAKGE